MKHTKALSIILFSAVVSSSCAGLAGLMGGGITLAPTSTSLTENTDGLALASNSAAPTVGYVAAVSAPADPNADASYLYGIFAPQ